ncbi:unnamed protein product [Leptidea sinapis]|uniref:Uncharacterized protein n=1 Tax=Leptidea sinapis TaxID=189913 RepID=A0A5E4QR73_9NEOP|nr:unnamed protein product [Leptidea sinapis]
MRVWRRARVALSMRLCCVTTVTTILAAMALRSAADPVGRRYPTDWHPRDIQLRTHPLNEVFESEAPTETERSYPQMSQVLHKERRPQRLIHKAN